MNKITEKPQPRSNYFYAKKEKIVNGEKFLEVPIIVNTETAAENGHHYSMVRIGLQKCPCIYDWIPESYYRTHKRMLEKEAKIRARNDRCLIDNPKKYGERIRCPEKNRCSTCPYHDSPDFDSGHDTSLEMLMESNYNMENGCDEEGFDISAALSDPEEQMIRNEENAELEEKLLVLIDLLMKKKPRYADIFRELCNGEHNAAAIARRFGWNPNRTAEDVKMIKELVKDWLEELRT